MGLSAGERWIEHTDEVHCFCGPQDVPVVFVQSIEGARLEGIGSWFRVENLHLALALDAVARLEVVLIPDRGLRFCVNDCFTQGKAHPVLPEQEPPTGPILAFNVSVACEYVVESAQDHVLSSFTGLTIKP